MKNKAKPQYELLHQFVICPCCRERRLVQETILGEYIKALDATRSDYRFQAERVLDWRDQGDTQFANTWACLSCLKKGRALRVSADHEYQGMSGPKLAYVAVTQDCRDCGEKFVFEPEEQRFWYETLEFSFHSRPVRCAPCRRAVRDTKALHKQLGELLSEQKPDVDRLSAIRDTYAALGLTEKAELCERRLKNQRRRQS